MQISTQRVYAQSPSFRRNNVSVTGNTEFATQFAGLTSMKSGGEYHVFLPNKNTAYSGGQANGLSFKIDYAENSTPQNPIVIASGVDENGNRFEQELVLKDIDPKNATIVEFRALEAHLNGGKMASVGTATSLIGMGNHGENQQPGLNTRQNFLEKMLDKYNFFSNSPYLNHQMIALDYKNQLELWSKHFKF